MCRTISILIFTFLSAVCSVSQTPLTSKCKLTLSQVSIRGVKLGMTTDEVFALFPGAAEEPQNQSSLQRAVGFPNFGSAHLVVTPNRDAVNKNVFKALETYFMTFDGKVVQFDAYYQGPNSTPRGPQFPNTDELISKFSETYHLPGPGEWVDRNGSAKALTCAGLEFIVAGGSSAARASLVQSPPSWPDEIAKRRLAFEDKLRSEFKP